MGAGRTRRVLLAGVRWALTLAAVAFVGVGVVSYKRMLCRTSVRYTGQAFEVGQVSVVGGTVMWHAQQGGSALGPWGRGADVTYDIVPWQPFSSFGTAWWPPWGSCARIPTAVSGTFPLWPWVGLCGVAAAGLWYQRIVAWRRRRVGACPCEYSREGLAAGAAYPECGVVPGAAAKDTIMKT